MIDPTQLEALLTDQPEWLREYGRILTVVLNELEESMTEIGCNEAERRAACRTVVAAIRCHHAHEPPPNEEVAFWMRMLDPAVTLPLDPKVQ